MSKYIPFIKPVITLNNISNVPKLKAKASVTALKLNLYDETAKAAKIAFSDDEPFKIVWLRQEDQSVKVVLKNNFKETGILKSVSIVFGEKSDLKSCYKVYEELKKAFYNLDREYIVQFEQQQLSLNFMLNESDHRGDMLLGHALEVEETYELIGQELGYDDTSGEP